MRNTLLEDDRHTRWNRRLVGQVAVLIMVNAMVIAYVERTPDTLVTLLNGERFHVLSLIHI